MTRALERICDLPSESRLILRMIDYFHFSKSIFIFSNFCVFLVAKSSSKRVVFYSCLERMYMYLSRSAFAVVGHLTGRGGGGGRGGEGGG